MEKRRIKSEKILIVLAIILLLTLCIFTTLAYFKYRYSSEPIIITTTDLNLNVTTSDLKNNIDIQPTTWSNNMDDNNNNKNIAQVKLYVNSTSKIKATYEVNMQSSIKQNDKYTGGEISDIKYKVYQENNLISEGEFTSEVYEKIIDGNITLEGDLSEAYTVYVYINETGIPQDSLKDISFDFKFEAIANQIEE